MKPFAPRYLLLVAFSILLGACQSAPTLETPASQVQPDAFAQLEQNIASNELRRPRINSQRYRPPMLPTSAWSRFSDVWQRPT